MVKTFFKLLNSKYFFIYLLSLLPLFYFRYFGGGQELTLEIWFLNVGVLKLFVVPAYLLYLVFRTRKIKSLINYILPRFKGKFIDFLIKLSFIEIIIYFVCTYFILIVLNFDFINRMDILIIYLLFILVYMIMSVMIINITIFTNKKITIVLTVVPFVLNFLISYFILSYVEKLFF